MPNSSFRISEKNISKSLTWLYILALSAVALLTIVGQVLIQIALTEQMSDSRVINLAGRQRMLSQKIAKASILLAHPEIYKEDETLTLADYKSSLAQWHYTHESLIAGKFKNDPSIKVRNSDTISHMFIQLEPTFLVMYDNAMLLNQLIGSHKVQENKIAKDALNEILKNEKLFLHGMNQIVYQYDKEAKAGVARLRKIELGLFITTLIILLLEGVFIFKPAVQHIRKTIKALIEAESQEKAVNEQLKNTKEELLIAVKEKYLQQINEQKIRSVFLIKGQEKERNRIAKDIHDGLGQMLTALKLATENIDFNNLPEKEIVIIEDIRSMIIKTIAETRTISFNLMPTVLNDFGIISGLRLLADQASKSTEANITFLYKSDFSRINKDLEIGIYRIAQEAINNAQKYSQASEINMELQLVGSNIVLKVSDNGKGFNLKKISNVAEVKKVRMGISNMQERTHLLNGHFKIESALNKGTRITVELPVNYAEEV
jgi:signal transduction histidine kinase